MVRKVEVEVETEIEEEIEIEEEKKPSKPPTAKFSFFNSLLDLGASKDLANDWIKVRKDKKASNTQTAFSAFENQVKASKYSIDQILTVCVSESWKGFKASWDLTSHIQSVAIINPSNEEIVKYNSNVNPTVFEATKSQFLALQKKNAAGGYIYKILNQ